VFWFLLITSQGGWAEMFAIDETWDIGPNIIKTRIAIGLWEGELNNEYTPLPCYFCL
jgi:hypothetical protein